MSLITEKNRKWWGLGALMPSLAMVFTDQTVLPVALPTIQKYLEATDVQLQWCINSYLLVTAVLVLAGGKLGDRIGYRRAYTLGMVIFALASALCGLAPDVIWLIAARALQGVGAALMVPATTPLLMTLFSPHERGKATGFSVSISSLFLIFGPLIGGYFTQELSWRWIFWINLPIAILGLVLALLLLPRSSKGEQKFDPLGFIFFVISCSLLVIVIMQGTEWGWTSFKTATLSVLCLVAAFFLFWREKKAAHPFLDLKLFRLPIYKAVNISIFVTQFILMITVYRAIFFQDVMDWSPLKTGWIFFISSSPVFYISPVGGWLSDRFGPKLPLAVGFTLLIFSFLWLAFFVQSPFKIVLFLGFIAFGTGVPLILTPSYASAMNAVPPNKIGVAFGTVATMRTLASTLGVAIIAAVTGSVQYSSFSSLIQRNEETRSLNLSALEGLASGAQSAKEYLQSLSMDTSRLVLQYLKESEIAGFFYTHLGIGLALIVAFSCVFVLYHRKSAHHLPEMPGEGWD